MGNSFFFFQSYRQRYLSTYMYTYIRYIPTYFCLDKVMTYNKKEFSTLDHGQTSVGQDVGSQVQLSELRLVTRVKIIAGGESWSSIYPLQTASRLKCTGMESSDHFLGSAVSAGNRQWRMKHRDGGALFRDRFCKICIISL